MILEKVKLIQKSYKYFIGLVMPITHSLGILQEENYVLGLKSSLLK